MRYLILLLVGSFLLTPLVQAEDFEGKTQPADVLLAVNQVAADLETVRAYMGRPPVVLPTFTVEFAAPRHVFYQAQALFRKINRLGGEVGGFAKVAPATAPESDIGPADVLRMVNSTQQQLDRILGVLELQRAELKQSRNPRTQPKDVFEQIVQVNRSANLMMDMPFRPADVYEQLELAWVYLGGVLANQDKPAFPNVAFVANKHPGDVYDRLIDCLVVNQRIGEKLKVPVLQINARRLRRDRSILSDNYEVATMLLSDIAFWSEELAGDDDVFPEDEGLSRIFPAHVFVKTNALLTQLETIAENLP